MPNNKTIISASEDKTLRIWNIPQKRQKFYKLFVHPITCLALTYDYSHILCATGDKCIIVLNYHTKVQKCSLSGHRSRINSLVSTFDSNYIVSASADRTIRIFSLKKSVQEFFLICHEDSINTILLLSPSLLLSSSYDCTVRLWSLNLAQKIPNLSKLSIFQRFLQPVLCIATDDNIRVAIGCYDGSIKVWNIKTNKIVSKNCAHDDSVNCLSVKINLLASCSADCKVNIWDIDSLVRKVTIAFKDVLNVIKWSNNCKYLISAGWDKILYIYSYNKQKVLAELSGHSGDVTCIYYFQNQDLMVSGSTDNSVRLWDLGNKRLDHIYIGHRSRVTSISVNEEGEQIASGSWDKCVKVWNVRSRKLTQNFDEHDTAVNSVKFTRSGKYCVSVTESKTYVWKIKNN